MVKERTESFDQADEKLTEKYELILFNDKVNTFEFVIETLIDVCEHDPISAEQCALITHYNGKCAVKSGEFNELKPIHLEMSERGLTVSIN
nr:ATP-dependent Clp protease adaptor ClpS [Bacteroidota bacterium]